MRTASSLVILTLVAAAAPARAQQSPALDARWTAWLGCWQQLGETVRDENDIEPRPIAGEPTRGVVVCVTPAASGPGVTLRTIAEKQFALEETIVADGSTRAIDEPGCTGTQRAEWSANGRRVYARAELSCLDGTKRTVSGLSTIAPGPVWVDVQVVDAAGGRESIRVRRYQRAPDQTQVSGQLSSPQLAQAAKAAASQGTSFSLEEVKEASAKLAPSALEAGLIETQARFPLNAKRLVELDDAGVPDRVIDLMVAMAFPNKFVIERRVTSPVPMPTGGSIFGPEWIDLGYGMFPYYYAPFGYAMWGRYDYYGYYGGPIYFFDAQSVRGGGQAPAAQAEGRVIDGLGYTRVRAREPQPTGGDGGSGGTGGVASSGGSSSGGGGVTSQGYSGGGGGDSGRTAVPRPPD